MSLFVAYQLKDAISRFEFFEKVFEKQLRNPKEDFKFELYKTNLKEAYMDITNSLNECKYMKNSYYNLESATDLLLSLLDISKEKLFNSVTQEDYLNAIKLCNKTIKSFDIKLVEEANRYDYVYFYRDGKDSYSFSLGFCNVLRNSLKNINRNLKILNAYTRYGFEGGNFKRQFSENNYELYGIDITQDVSDSYKKYYTRLLYGDLKGAFITNDVFDICFYTTPIELEQRKTFSGTFNKTEKIFLQKIIQYIRKDGYLFLSIPKFRLAKDICSMLAKNFEDFQLFKDDLSSNKNNNIYILARKKSIKTDINVNIYSMLRYDIDKYLKSIKEYFDENKAFDNIILPKIETELKQFRGSVIDESELESLYQKSSCTSSFWKDQNSNVLEEEKIPLLPFNAGQIGLILTSGFLDGIIDEGNGFYHVVKGRTVKRTDGNDEIHAESNSVEVTEITSNRVEINAFSPDGTFKKLV